MSGLRDGWTALLLGIAVLGTVGGLTGFGLGIWCYTEPDPGMECAALTALPPLVGLPAAGAAAIFGAARAGWLTRFAADDEDEWESEQVRRM